jgi:ATP-dependent DNA ligase
MYKTLYEIIKALQSTQGTKAKQAILDENKDNELLKQYMKAVFDPAINYYQKKLPKVSFAGKYEVKTDTLEALRYRLAERTVTGKTAVGELKNILALHTKEGQELISYIIKRQIPDSSVGEKMVLKTWPGLFFCPPYQRCASMSDKIKERFASLPFFYVQTKSDGQFSYLIKEAGKTPISMSRAGSIYPSWLPEKLSKGLPDGIVLAGEMVVYENGKLLNRQTGNGILNSLLSGDGDKFDPETMAVQFIAWDMLTVNEFRTGRSVRPYELRFVALDSIINANKTPFIRVVNHWVVTSIAEAIRIQNEHLARKEEGTVWKDPAMPWRDCSSGDPMQVKAKLAFQADYRIDGMFEGEGKYKGMCGGFNMSTCDDLIKFNVGTGFSDAQRKEFWENDPSGKIATIEGNDIVTSGGKDTESMFLPVLIEVREDKKEADSRERVWEQFNAARGL